MDTHAQLRRRHAARRQRGMALVVTLMILMVITLLAITAARMGTQEERMSRATRERQIAFQASEAALVDARQELFSAAGSTRSMVFSGASSFTADCGTAQPGSGSVFRGLCLPATTGTTPAWQTYMNTQGVTRGTFARNADGTTAPAFDSTLGHQGAVSAQPRYLIEVICSATVGESLRFGAGCQRPRYRTTSQGFGASAGTSALVQESVRLE
ncbi:MAG: hypothetical protein HGA47_02650 [Zoogloea sp.]|nr:hypothetical protein [Zoogloea sp.]